jgi:hypothetical protein
MFNQCCKISFLSEGGSLEIPFCNSPIVNELKNKRSSGHELMKATTAGEGFSLTKSEITHYEHTCFSHCRHPQRVREDHGDSGADGRLEETRP